MITYNVQVTAHIEVPGEGLTVSDLLSVKSTLAFDVVKTLTHVTRPEHVKDLEVRVDYVQEAQE